jgi:hypothetical protein
LIIVRFLQLHYKSMLITLNILNGLHQPFIFREYLKKFYWLNTEHCKIMIWGLWHLVKHTEDSDISHVDLFLQLCTMCFTVFCVFWPTNHYTHTFTRGVSDRKNKFKKVDSSRRNPTHDMLNLNVDRFLPLCKV